MIVDKHLADEIRRGKATVFRIPARKGKAGAPYAKIGYEVAHDYPVRTGPGKDPVCTIRVASVERERFEPTLVQARAAGFRTVDDLREWWIVRHEQTWLRAQLFHILPTDPASIGEDVAHAVLAGLLWRFNTRWWGAEVWVITFAVTTDTPLFMAQQRGLAVGDGQYTHLPSRSVDPDAECIERERQEKYAAAARAISDQRRSSLKRDLDDERLRRRRARLELFRTVA